MSENRNSAKIASGDFSLKAVIMLFCVVSSVATGDEKLPPLDDRSTAIVQKAWREIQSSISESTPDWTRGSTESDNQWIGLIESIRKSFGPIKSASNRKPLISEFINQFGTKGPRADFAYILALEDAAFSYEAAGLHSTEPPEAEFQRRFQIEVAEAQVRFFLKHPKQLERYCYFLIWGTFITERKYPAYKEWSLLRMNIDDEYWWRARDLLTLIVVTGHQEILVDAKPEEMFSVGLRWAAKVDKGFTPQRLPMHPLPEWKGPKPPPGQWIRELY